jgi:hypothetical protein
MIRCGVRVGSQARFKKAMRTAINANRIGTFGDG